MKKLYVTHNVGEWLGALLMVQFAFLFAHAGLFVFGHWVLKVMCAELFFAALALAYLLLFACGGSWEREREASKRRG